MANDVTWMNGDGLLVRFGARQGERKDKAGVVRTAGNRRELVLRLDLAGAARTIFSTDRNNDGTLDGFTVGLDTPLPSGAKIKSFDLIQIEAPAGGTSFTIGTFLLDGTAVDDDGIRVSAGTDGAQVGTQLTADAYVTAKTTGTYTAGIYECTIQYIVR